MSDRLTVTKVRETDPFARAREDMQEEQGYSPNSSGSLWVYHVPPIDHWAGWTHERVFVRSLASGAWSEYFRRRFRAEEYAAIAGWEGDMREGPYIAGLPQDAYGQYLIAWKQENNGNTFVASPLPLPWLVEDAFKIVKNGTVWPVRRVRSF